VSTLSRVAENLYWLGRYIERAEGIARLVEVEGRFAQESRDGRTPAAGWDALLTVVGSRANFDSLYRATNRRNVTDFLLVNTKNPGSVVQSVRYARHNARTVRDALTRDVWEHLNEFYLRVTGWTRKEVTTGSTEPWTTAVKLNCQQHVGILEGTLSRSEGFQFVLLGRNLERADMTSRLMDYQTLLPVNEGPDADVYEASRWLQVLHSLGGYQMYRTTMQATVNHSEVMRFLIQDARFPRSVRHCLENCAASLSTLPRGRTVSPAVRKLVRTMRERDVSKRSGPALHKYIDKLQLSIARTHTDLARAYFLAGVAE